MRYITMTTRRDFSGGIKKTSMVNKQNKQLLDGGGGRLTLYIPYDEIYTKTKQIKNKSRRT